MENKKEKNNKVVINKGEEIMKNVLVEDRSRREEVKIETRVRDYGKFYTKVITENRLVIKRFEGFKVRSNVAGTRFYIINHEDKGYITITAREVAALSNLYYQVNNGGIDQWRYNGYSSDDRQVLIRVLEKLEMDELRNYVYGCGRSQSSSDFRSYRLYDMEIWHDVEDLLTLVDTEVRNMSDNESRILSPNNSKIADAIKGEF